VPPNNRMQELTRSAPLQGRLAPPSQLISVFGGLIRHHRVEQVMAERFALYSRTHSCLPADQVASLVTGMAPAMQVTAAGLTRKWAWPDLEVVCSEMPDTLISAHLEGFAGFARSIAGEMSAASIEPLLERIRATTLVVGIEVAPERDREGRAEDLIGKLAFGLQPLLFFEDAIYDERSRLILCKKGPHPHSLREEGQPS
jgi:hypothetical protein